MLYDLTLHMGYIYDTLASGARHIIRIMPLSIPGRQRLIAGTLSVSPSPEERTVFDDFFQQTATSVYLRASHDKLDIRMQARVSVESTSLTADFSPELVKLPRELANVWSLDPQSPHHFAGISPRIGENAAIAAYARETIMPGMTIREIAMALCKRIYKDFKYDGEATTVDTTPAQAFKLKRGVCQDFSHIMICALRSPGFPQAMSAASCAPFRRPARNGWKGRMPCTPGCASGAARRRAISSSTPPMTSSLAAIISSSATVEITPTSPL